MNCEDLLKALNEYVDGETESAISKEFRKHLADCHPCRIVVDNVKKTITLFKDGKPYELPAPFRDQLYRTLRARWSTRFQAPGPGAAP